MKMIVGLGNPGKKYNKTLHNIGFLALDKFIYNKFKLKFKNIKFYSYILLHKIKMNNILFVKPLTYINNSGINLKKIIYFYNISKILVIHDDIDIKIGNIKICYGRGHAGHNGVKNIILNLKTKNFFRIRIGVGRPKNLNINEYLLSNYSNSFFLNFKDSMLKVQKEILKFCYKM